MYDTMPRRKLRQNFLFSVAHFYFNNYPFILLLLSSPPSFPGVVSEVWITKGARQVFAHVKYSDKDEEDLSIDDLLPRLKPKRARR